MRTFFENLVNPPKYAKGIAPGGKGKVVKFKKIGGPPYAERERKMREQMAKRQ